MKHDYEIRPRKDKRGFDLVSDALPFGHLWYLEVGAAIAYATFYSRSDDAVIHVYDEASKVIPSTQTQTRFRRTVSHGY